MINCAMIHVRIHARMHVYMRVYMSNPFAHAHNAHACRMLADYQQRSAYARAASVRGPCHSVGRPRAQRRSAAREQPSAECN